MSFSAPTHEFVFVLHSTLLAIFGKNNLFILNLIKPKSVAAGIFRKMCFLKFDKLGQSLVRRYSAAFAKIAGASQNKSEEGGALNFETEVNCTVCNGNR